MPITRATVTLTAVSGAPVDNVVNVWHFEHGGTLDESIAGVIGDGLVGFYLALQTYWNETVSHAIGGNTIELASLSMGASGAADDVVTAAEFIQTFPETFAWPGQSVVNIPSENASCLSFQGLVDGIPEETGMTRPRARRRGRVYLGPFNENVFGVSVANNDLEQRVSSAFRTAALDAYEAMIVAIQTAPENVTHVIYSPTSGLAFVVKSAWMDNAFDTMRSRGQPADQRTTRILA